MDNKILVAGSINMDVVINVKRLPKKGESVHGETIKYIPGGKGANQAVAASRLGAKVAFIGKVGSDNFGNELLTFLKSENIDTSAVEKSKLPSGMAQITVEKGGQNTIVILKGANEEVTEKYVKGWESLIKDSNIVVSQYEIPLPSVKNLFELAKKHNKITILNPSPAYYTASDVLRNVDYLVVNENELQVLTSSSAKNLNVSKIAELAKRLIARGAKVVVVTLGPKGAVAVAKSKIIRSEGLKVDAVDATAAGDCFVGAMAVAISNNISLDEALRFANRAAAISVQRRGASSSLPKLSEVEIK